MMVVEILKGAAIPLSVQPTPVQFTTLLEELSSNHTSHLLGHQENYALCFSNYVIQSNMAPAGRAEGGVEYFVMSGKLFWKFRSPQSGEEVNHGSLMRWQNGLANSWTSSHHQCEKSKFSIPSPNVFPVKTVLQRSDVHIKQHLQSDRRDSIATVVPYYRGWYLEKSSTFEGFLYQKLRYCLTVSRCLCLCSKDRKFTSYISSLHLKKKKN